MADGTVTGEFRLYTVQARREFERLQREGKDTDRVMERTGRSMDKIGDRDQQRQVRTYRTHVRALGTTSRTSSRDVDRLSSSIDKLSTNVSRATFGGGRGGGRATTGGGGGAGGVRGGVLGLSGGIKQMAAMAVVALPVIRALGGAVGALGASVASAAGGAGAVGAAGIGGLVVGIGGIAAVAMPAAKRIKEIADAQEKYNDAIRRYGKESEQAGMARRELRGARARGPAGAGALVREARQFSRAWNDATASGQRNLVGFMREVIATGRKLRRPLAEISNQVTQAFTMQGRRGLKFMEGGRIRAGLRAGAGIFTDNLGNVRRVGQATVEMFLNVMRASRPFVKQFTTFMAQWFGTQQRRSRNIVGLRRAIGGMVDDLKSVGKLGGAGIRLLMAVFGVGARQAGRGLIDRATEQLDKWTRWLQANPTKVQAFFRQAADDAAALAGALVTVVGALNQIATALRPIIPGITAIANLSGSIGGPGTVGMAGALLGGYRGARGRPKGPGVIGTLLGRGRGAAPAAGGAAARMGAGGMLRAGLMGAGRAYWPIAAGMAGLAALGTEGSGRREGQAALSSLSFGLVHAPKSFEELQAQGAERVADYRQPRSIAGAGRRLRANVAEQARLQASLTKVVERPGFGPGTPVERVRLPRGTDEEREVIKGNIEKLKQHAEALRLDTEALKEMRAEREVIKAPKLAADVQRAYRIRARRPGGAQAAGEGFVSGTYAVMGQQASVAGKKAVAQANITWLNEQRRHNPALQKVYDHLVGGIERRFHRLGQNIQVVNGRIYKNTDTAWKHIANTITTQSQIAMQEGMKAFTAIQKQAINGLVQLGFQRKDAKGFVQGAEDITAASGGKVTGKAALDAGRGAYASGQRYKAAGDAAKKGDGPGRDDLGRGAVQRAAARTTGAASSLMGAKPGLGVYASDAAGYGLHVSSGARPGATTVSGNTSYHSSGDALDLAGPAAQMLAFARHLSSTAGSGLAELIHTPAGNAQIKNGSPFVYSGAVAQQHYDHVHVADPTPPGALSGAGGAGAGTAGAGTMGSVRVHAPRSRFGGLLGANLNAASSLYAAAMNKKLKNVTGGGGGGGAPSKGIWNFNRVAKLAESVGLPGVTFAQIAKGESGFNPQAVGHDPGGTQGLGLWQITTGYNDDIIKQFGGRNAMFNAHTNALAAKAIYDRAGIGAWYGTRYKTGNNLHYQGDGPGFRGWFRNGGSFTAHHPQLIGVGDGVGSEQVTIGKGGAGGRPIMVNITMGTVKVASVDEAGGVGEKIGTQVAAKIAQALREAPIGAPA